METDFDFERIASEIEDMGEMEFFTGVMYVLAS